MKTFLQKILKYLKSKRQELPITMINNKKFKKWATNNKNEKLDLSSNTGSKFFNRKATRIAYYKFTGEIK